ncbi:MAG: fumarylacetoacetate hydrolase family protein [Bacteroidetes bacterium]|nr:fumarylacetoacetate hydrolase family protein [Bacteroidota bacterium]MDA1119467.1 fumarylacetoacetate hydrolase family protein [Bacteroidota bacterium]
MKLVRFGKPGAEKPGILNNNQEILDVSDIVNDYDENFFASDGVATLEKNLAKSSKVKIPAGTRLGSPIGRPSKIICVGLNYAKHAAESGMDIPKEPILFYKSTTSLTGPNDNIIIPKGGDKTDWEVELAIVIGKRASYIDKAEAFNYIAGYALHNDVSERAFQLERGGQWLKGKSADSFAPLGPWLVTKDEITNPNTLDLWLKLNGETIQSSNTSDMIFDVPHLVSYISQFMTLLPGDVISTGTPSGVGMGLNPPRYLKPGDIVELGIDGLGISRQETVAYQG